MVKLDKQQIRSYILDLAKRGAMKIGLSWLAKKAVWATTGPLGWLTGIIMNQIWDMFGEKIVNYTTRKGFLVYDRIDGKIKAIKIKKSRGTNDSSYDDSVDDVFD